jgi:hypothetical protein
MKQIKYIFLILAVVLLGNITLADDPIELRIPDLTSIVGDFIDIPIYVDNSLTGEDVYSFQFKIYYYGSRLSFESIETAGTLVQSWGTPLTNSSELNYLTIAGAGATPLVGTGVLFYMRFECISSGSTPVDFNGGADYNFFNEGSPGITSDNGSVNISALPVININPNSGLLTVGDQLQFTVSGGTGPYNWYVTEPGLASINTSGLLTANSHGFTKVVVEDNMGIRDTTSGLIEIRAMQLRIPDTSAWQGSSLAIPIYTTDLTGLNITSGNYGFTFNQNILNAVSFSTTGTKLDGYNVSFNNSIGGAVNVAFAGTTALSGGGVLMFINFDVSEVNTGNTVLNFSSALFNEDLQATTDNGYFTMINYSTIYLSPNTASIVAGETLQFTASGGLPPYTWSSSDPAVASIDGAGILTAHQSGIIQVTVTDDVGSFKTSGNITVYDTYVSLPHVYATLGSQYDMPVLISAVPVGQSIFSLQGSISCESPELEIIEIVTLGTMTSGWTFSSNIDGNSITFAGAGTVPFTMSGAMFKVKFQLTGDLVQGENAWVHIDDIVLNEGFPAPTITNGSITGTGGIILDLKANLEGPFNGADMNADLNPWRILKNQPYNTSPWYYNGSESFASVPNGDVVDWILVELRETTGGPATALPATQIGRRAGLLLRDGSIVSTDGISKLIFGVSVTNNLYAIVWHRNHLGMMSAFPLTLGGGIYSYDFTNALSKAYLNGQISLGGGKYGMYAGNADGNSTINNSDITLKWNLQAGVSGYHSADLDLDGQVNSQDKNDVWLPNNGEGTQVPD